jgi:hypothetical protein
MRHAAGTDQTALLELITLSARRDAAVEETASLVYVQAGLWSTHMVALFPHSDCLAGWPAGPAPPWPVTTRWTGR